MDIKRLFDRVRLAVFISCLLFQYIHSYIVTIKYVSFKYNSIVNSVLFILEISSFLYFFLSCTRRGYLDYKLEKEDLLNCNLTRRFCKICDGFKPERVHHCSSCKRCIKKMDHHCMWMGVCVNYYNHGDFIRCLFSITFSSSIINLYNLWCFYFYYKEYIKLQKYEVGLMVLSFLLSGLIGAICSYMVKIQLKLIFKNITFIEELKYEDLYHEKSHNLKSAYDRGAYNNFKEVFGSPYLLFLWKPSGNGISYVRNQDPMRPSVRNSLYYDFV